MLKRIISLSMVVLMMIGLLYSTIGCSLIPTGGDKVKGEFDYVTYDSDTYEDYSFPG